MSNFDIYVDSAANLPDAIVEKTGIKVIPFTHTIDGEENQCYGDGIFFSEAAKKFYEKLSAGADVKTSLVCEENFVKAVTPSMEQGKDVLVITITASLSGTNAQAHKAVNSLKTLFPDRKMYVIDSANASLGEGLLAINTAAQRDAGKTLEECRDWAEDNKYKIHSHVTVNDLKYLRKSGRVSTIVAVAGALLNIKPLLKADSANPATLAVYSKERGRKKSIDALIRAFAEHVTEPENQTIYIAHGNCEDEAVALADKLKELGARDAVIEYYDLCTGAHVGPGTLALFFTGNDRRGNIQKKK